jgi:hypothetical protein
MTGELPTPNGGLGFLNVNATVAAAALEQWHRSHAWFAAAPQGLAVERVEGPLCGGIARLHPFGAGS